MFWLSVWCFYWSRWYYQNLNPQLSHQYWWDLPEKWGKYKQRAHIVKDAEHVVQVYGKSSNPDRLIQR